MSIVSEITRLLNAKEAIREAIEAKGVTIPSNAKLDQFAFYISSIETGGGEVSGLNKPVFSFSNNIITITCSTPGADIYYRSDEGEYSLYVEPIIISESGTYYAYSVIDNDFSDDVEYYAIYTPPYIENPVFSISNNSVSITCSTSGAIIYYKIESDSQWSIYSTPIIIEQDTTFISYTEKDGYESEQITYLALYNSSSPIVDYSNEYLTFTITSNGIIKTSNYVSEQYSYQKNGGSWSYVDSDISVTTGDIVKFKGDCRQYNHIRFKDSTCGFIISGNIMSIYLIHFESYTSLSIGNCFDELFSGCTGLTSAENLILPSTSLVNYCYFQMFKDCTSLITAPELPALNITTQGSYSGMFNGCSSLNYIKCLAINRSGQYAFDSWVKDVSATGTFIKNSSATDWPIGIEGIPSGWSIQDAS